jgi:hypothetical protein
MDVSIVNLSSSHVDFVYVKPELQEAEKFIAICLCCQEHSTTQPGFTKGDAKISRQAGKQLILTQYMNSTFIHVLDLSGAYP